MTPFRSSFQRMSIHRAVMELLRSNHSRVIIQLNPPSLEVRYLSSRMAYVKVLLSGIFMVAVTIQLHQCIHFRINLIVRLSSTFDLILNVSQRTLRVVKYQSL